MSPTQKLLVSNLEKSLTFYLSLLGFEVERHDEIAVLRLPHEQVLELREQHGAAPGMARLLIDDAQSLHAHVELHALAPFTKLKRQRWGTWEFALLDPDQNQLTVYSMKVT
ncbi:VOC family protein [Granulicoccus phenolivorans]|uniref:VOC family protein n=1 Tax=Granulicoccus phenolivorans TaxID=266854 RepID=UPI00047D9E52|nr:VOC family protein [Granulicoccus phenolivorans]